MRRGRGRARRPLNASLALPLRNSNHAMQSQRGGNDARSGEPTHKWLKRSLANAECRGRWGGRGAHLT